MVSTAGGDAMPLGVVVMVVLMVVGTLVVVALEH
jgi:hypothetical protein